MHACLVETGHLVRVRHVLDLEGEYLHRDILNDRSAASALDSDRFKDLKLYYQPSPKDEVDDVFGIWWGRWAFKDEHQERNLSVLADDLVPFSRTDAGFYDGTSTKEIVDDWTKNYAVKQVKWLNKPKEKALALVHGAVSPRLSEPQRIPPC